MPKIITVKRQEGEHEKAREYVKTHILFPSGLIGLALMLSGTGFLGYQFIAETYSWRTFVDSTGLLALGGTLGWVQTRYHRFLVRTCPEVFASRMKTFSRTRRGRHKREMPAPAITHPGRRFVPLGYVAGALLLLGASALSIMSVQVYFPAAVVLPWAGFFWAKLFFWRSVLAPMRKVSPR